MERRVHRPMARPWRQRRHARQQRQAIVAPTAAPTWRYSTAPARRHTSGNGGGDAPPPSQRRRVRPMMAPRRARGAVAAFAEAASVRRSAAATRHLRHARCTSEGSGVTVWEVARARGQIGRCRGSTRGSASARAESTRGRMPARSHHPELETRAVVPGGATATRRRDGREDKCSETTPTRSRLTPAAELLMAARIGTCTRRESAVCHRTLTASMTPEAMGHGGKGRGRYTCAKAAWRSIVMGLARLLPGAIAIVVLWPSVASSDVVASEAPAVASGRVRSRLYKCPTMGEPR